MNSRKNMHILLFEEVEVKAGRRLRASRYRAIIQTLRKEAWLKASGSLVRALLVSDNNAATARLCPRGMSTSGELSKTISEDCSLGARANQRAKMKKARSLCRRLLRSIADLRASESDV